MRSSAPLPEGAPFPAAPSAPRPRPSAERLRPQRRSTSDGAQGHHSRRRGRRRSSWPTRFSVSSRAPTSCIASSTGSWPSAGPARIRSRAAREIRAPARSSTSRRAPAAPVTARARAAVPRRRQALGPVVRSHERPAEEGAGARPEACAFGQGQGRQADRARRAELKDAKTKALAARFEKLGWESCW